MKLRASVGRRKACVVQDGPDRVELTAECDSDRAELKELVSLFQRHSRVVFRPGPAPAEFRVNMLRLAPKLSHADIDLLADMAAGRNRER